jgi:transposase
MALYHIHLSSEERILLEGIIKKRTGKAEAYKYAQILLHSDKSFHSKVLSADSLSKQYGVSEKTVERVRRRFCEEGMGIFEAKVRQSRSDKKFDARVEAHLLAICCQSPPNDSPKWQLQMLADKLVEQQVVDTISRSSVCVLLKKMNLSLFGKSNM